MSAYIARLRRQFAIVWHAVTNTGMASGDRTSINIPKSVA
jgi:hypothetical protein